MTGLRHVAALILAVCLVASTAASCFHSTYNDPNACRLPQVPCKNPDSVCILGVCVNPDGPLPFDLAGFDGDRDALPNLCASSIQCADDGPICAAQQCRKCMSGADDFECGRHSAVTPRCDVPSGHCVACLTSMDCGNATPVCDATVCRKCVAHSECATGICKPDGACALATEVAYVNNSVGTCSDVLHPSTTATPYCQAQVAALSAGKAFVVVAGSATPYNALNLTATTAPINITIVGPGRTASPKATIAQTMLPGAAITASGQSVTVVLDGLELFGSAGVTKSAGVTCNGPSGTANLTVQNASIRDSGKPGIESSNCILTVDGTVIGPNNAGGITLTATTYAITNTIIINNLAGVAGVTIDGPSTGTIAFVTIAFNGGASPIEGGINCPSAGANKVIQSSIVASNANNAGTQFSGKCQLQNVVTGLDTFAGANQAVPVFVSGADARLATNPANVTCCVDKIANPTTPKAERDVDGAYRPKGGSWDFGAHELQ